MFIKEKERIYMNDENGKMVAEITFPEVKDGINEIDHTFVDSSLRGQGIAGKLVREAVDQIRENGNKPVPTCSYAVKWFEKEDIEF